MSRSSSSMATVLVVLIVVSAGGLSPPCAAAAKEEEEKPVVVLPPAAAPGEAPSAEAAAFVRSCCDTLQSDRVAFGFCYDELLPYADSFGGNQVKVAVAAATILETKLRAFVDEMRQVQGGEGKGDSNLECCVDGFSGVTRGNVTEEALDSLGRLAAAGDGKGSKEDLENVQKWIKDVDNNFHGGIGTSNACELGYLFTYSADLPTEKIIENSFITARSLINDIKLQ